jgi:DNA-binding response OmpR family regulator
MPTYVLILEDDEGVAELLCEAFREAGCRCFVLRKRATAERFLRRVRPDLIVVDYSLVGGNGLQAAQMAAEAKVPVIVTSGYLDVGDEVERLGFIFVEKPFRVTEMLALAAQVRGCDPPSS